MKPNTILISSAFALLLVQYAQAEEGPGHDAQRLSFSYLGLGIDSMTYEERLPDFYGRELKTEYSSSVPVLRTGVYTSISHDWGFAITTLASLYGDKAEEEWNWPGAGSIQTNEMAMTRKESNVFGFRQLGGGHYLTAGLNYSQYSFSRNAFRSTPGTELFNEAVFGELPAEQQEEMRLDPDANQGTISEDSVTVNVAVGYGYDNYFNLEQEGLRLFGSVLVGTPVFRRVTNTLLDGTLTDSVSESVNATLVAGAGWQFSASFSVNYVFEGTYVSLDKLEGDNELVPEVTFTSLANNLVAYWNF
ncbi:hypothetical protein [Hydrocarboniclastica marina]|uniref:hypothetical protein n=1 Tax=Hydrocarboniclastica marina TaxID=2259620 RepID=UPI0010A8BED2|nr:hypothetical protein [Hydrocarboniclastica marina]